MIRAIKRHMGLAVLLVAAVLLSTVSALAAPSIGSKRAEADQVLAQIQQIDADLGLAVDAYNGAQIRLDEIVAAQRVNQRRLGIARSNFGRARASAADRLVALYVAGEESTIEILLGATSLDDLLDRIDATSRVSEEDARIVREIGAFKREMRRREAELARARAEQERLVAERASRREAIEARLAERERLLASIKDEIAQLEVAEAARQRRLQAIARERLAQQAQETAAPAPTVATPLSEAPPWISSSPAPPPARYGGVVGIAMQYLGIPYRWGGASPQTGFDCSGFIMYVFAQIGVSLPHNAAAQYGYGTPVARDQLEPGDLVFFNGLGHNGIYIGGGQFIHSPHTGDVVKISSLSDDWYARTWVGARRL